MENTPLNEPAAAPKRIAGLAFVAALLSFLALSPGYVNNVDGYVVFHANEQFLQSGRLTVEEVPGREYTSRIPYVRTDSRGNRYQVYGHLFFWMTLPFTALGRSLAPVLEQSTPRLSEFTFSLANALYSALAVAAWLAVAVRLGVKRRSLPYLAVLLVFATPVLFYAVSMWREPGTTLLLGVGSLLLLRVSDCPSSRRRSLAFGVILGALFLFKEGNALLAGCLWFAATASAWKLGWRTGVRVGLYAGLPGLAAIALHCCVMLMRFDTPFTTCYDPSRSLVAGDPLLRLGRLLWSPDLGLLFYAAPVVLGLAGAPLLLKRSRALGLALFGSSILFLCLHSIVVSGEGGRFTWGPRHLTPLFPAFLVALALFMDRAIPLFRWFGHAIVLSSVLVQLLPIAQPYNLYPDLCERTAPEVAREMPSRIHGSALLAANLLSGRRVLSGAQFGVDASVSWDLSSEFSVRGVLNLWWLRADAPGGAPVVGGLLVLLASLAWVGLVRASRRTAPTTARGDDAHPIQA